MRESPRLRRLKSDHKALQQLMAESTIFSFTGHGDPPELYVLRFRGKGLWRPESPGDVRMHELHEVHVRLSAAYPRMMPELAWKTPIFHPNISASGVVCLGGYGTYWVPSLTLDELCTMLWDMIRYENYDETSPYNREAAAWVRNQSNLRLPIDARPLRDRVAGNKDPLKVEALTAEVIDPKPKPAKGGSPYRTGGIAPPVRSQPPVARPLPVARNDDADVIFLDDAPAHPHRRSINNPAAAHEEGGILFID